MSESRILISHPIAILILPKSFSGMKKKKKTNTVLCASHAAAHLPH
jgi:hypothetical protein